MVPGVTVMAQSKRSCPISERSGIRRATMAGEARPEMAAYPVFTTASATRKATHAQNKSQRSRRKTLRGRSKEMRP